MSADSSKSPVSANGWIAALLLTLLVFLVYYLPFPDGSIYISLAQQWEKNFLFQANDTNDTNDTEGTLQTNDANSRSRCRVFFKGPKQVVDFTENEFILVFQNSGGENSESDGKDCKWSIRIIVNVEPEALILIPIEVVDVEAKDQPKHIYTQQFSVEYDLKEFETKTILFRLLVPPGIYYLPRPVTITFQDTASRDNILWDGDKTTTNCTTHEDEVPKDEVLKDEVPNEKICLNIDLPNAIRESATKNLLLPPWSNRLIPFIVFAMVWLAEQILPNKKAWNDQPNIWLLALVLLGGFYLILFYAILYSTLLTNQPFISLFSASILISYVMFMPKRLSELFS